jgi:hypothetical protein
MAFQNARENTPEKLCLPQSHLVFLHSSKFKPEKSRATEIAFGQIILASPPLPIHHISGQIL